MNFPSLPTVWSVSSASLGGTVCHSRQRKDTLGSIGRRAWASSLAKVRDHYGDKEKNRAADEYPGRYVGAGGTADRKELTGDDQGASNRDPDNSGLVGLSYGSSHDRNSTARVCDVVSHAANAPREPIGLRPL